MEMIESGGIQQGATSGGGAAQPAAGVSGMSDKINPAGMQRQFSMLSLVSRSTAESKFTSEAAGHSKNSLVMSPSFKYGLHKKDQSPK